MTLLLIIIFQRIHSICLHSHEIMFLIQKISLIIFKFIYIIVLKHGDLIISLIIIFLILLLMIIILYYIYNRIYKIQNFLDNKALTNLTYNQFIYKLIFFSLFFYLIRIIFILINNYLSLGNIFILFLIFIIGIFIYVYLKSNMLKNSLINIFNNKWKYLEITILLFIAINLIFKIQMNYIIPIIAIFLPDLADKMMFILDTSIFTLFFGKNEIFKIFIQKSFFQSSDLIFYNNSYSDRLHEHFVDERISKQVYDMIKPIVNNIKNDKDFQLLLEWGQRSLTSDNIYAIRAVNERGVTDTTLVDLIPGNNILYNKGGKLTLFWLQEKSYSSVENIRRNVNNIENYLIIEVWKNRNSERSYRILKKLTDLFVITPEEIMDNASTDVYIVTSNDIKQYDPFNHTHRNKRLALKTAEKKFHHFDRNSLNIPSTKRHKDYIRGIMHTNLHLVRFQYLGK